MAKVVSKAIVSIEGLGVVRSIASIEVEDADEGTEPIFTLGPDPEPVGFQFGVPRIRISIEAKRLSPTEIDWWRWKANREQKLIQYEDVETEGDTGERWHLENCVVVSIGKSRTTEGADDRIELVATAHRPQQPLG